MPSEGGNIQRCLGVVGTLEDDIAHDPKMIEEPVISINIAPLRPGVDILEPGRNGGERFNGFLGLIHNIAIRTSLSAIPTPVGNVP
jgi:hypothetical protein